MFPSPSSQLMIQIVEVSLKMLSHDPNYNYDSDDEEAVADDDMDAEDYEELVRNFIHSNRT